jgi:hypothetical protein
MKMEGLNLSWLTHRLTHPRNKVLDSQRSRELMLTF